MFVRAIAPFPGWRRLVLRRRQKLDQASDYTLPVVSGSELLTVQKRAVLVRQIKSLVSATDYHFQSIYLETLRRWASFAQQLPASEAHHHSHKGGLLDHSLDVARRALVIRRQYLLPTGASPEVTTRVADRWTYAVFVSSLLHDAGKPATDQEIRLFSPLGTEVGVWNPWAGPMPTGHRYYMRFRSDRSYRRHEIVGAFLASRLLPPPAIEWIGADAELMTALIASLSHQTNEAGALSEIVELADSQSAAVALSGAEPQMPTTRKQKLSTVVLDTIRTLIEEGEIPLNRPGAGGFISNDALWLVSKRGMDRIRTKLRESGSVDIAPRNDRFMDDLQGQGIIIPNQDGRAVWRATVQSDDGEFNQELSFLKFPAKSLWVDAGRRPPDYDGVLSPKDRSAVAKDVSALPSSVDIAAPSPAKEATPPMNETHEVESPQPRTPPTNGKKTREHRSEPRTRRTSKSENEGPPPSISPRIKLDKEPAEFFEWLASGIRTLDLPINNPNAQLHVVPEGLFIVSPLIFKTYAGAEGSWSAVQKKVIKAQRHIRTPGGQNILLYRVEGVKTTSQLKGLVLKDPEKLLTVRLPKLNNKLTKMTSV